MPMRLAVAGAAPSGHRARLRMEEVDRTERTRAVRVLHPRAKAQTERCIPGRNLNGFMGPDQETLVSDFT